MDEQCQGRHPVGAQLRQPTVRRSDGSECRLDELLGRGFAVVGRKESDLLLDAEARSVLHRLGARTLSLEGLEACQGAMDDLFDAHPALVLRPDRYIFGVVDQERDLDRIVVELGRKLSLR